MEREDMEAQYDTDQWSNRPNKDQLLAEHWAHGEKESKKAESSIDNQMHVPYGKSARECLNIFGADSLPNDAPIFVYIHGGFWRGGNADAYGFIAVPLVKAGAVFVALEYDLTPKVTISEIVKQARLGVDNILEMADRRMSRGVYLCGHSAGGQLGAMAMADDKQQQLLQRHIKGALLISGIYDLRPICKITVNDSIKMTEDEAWENSVLPVVGNIRGNCPDAEIVFAVGNWESGEFKRQSMVCKEALEKCGSKVKYFEAPDDDHYTVVEKMVWPDSVMTKEALRLMGLQY